MGYQAKHKSKWDPPANQRNVTASIVLVQIKELFFAFTSLRLIRCGVIKSKSSSKEICQPKTSFKRYLDQDNPSLPQQSLYCNGNSWASFSLQLAFFILTDIAGNEALLPAPLAATSQNCCKNCSIWYTRTSAGCHRHRNVEKL
jgi:hypothetical protein